MAGPIPRSWAPWLLCVLRMVSAFLFLAHGSQKLFAWPVTEPRDAVAILSVAGIAGILEFFGGLLLFFGLFTRPVAFLLSGQMAVAYFWRHAPGGFLPILNRGELAVLYCFVFLYLAAAGGGAWSLDGFRTKRRS